MKFMENKKLEELLKDLKEQEQEKKVKKETN